MKRYVSIALVALTLLAVCAVGTGYFLLSQQSTASAVPAASAPAIQGHVYFLSSEQLSENSSQGINDEVQIILSHVTNPSAQKSYYAWLLGDKNQEETSTLFLGTLLVNGGNAHLFYVGDKQHTNLLETMSRFLVTEEDASTVTPISPSLDAATWRYYAEFSQTLPAPSDTSSGTNSPRYTFLDHLRHLQASEPLLDTMQLPGGLNNWFYRNTGKILEWTTSTRESWQEAHDMNFIRRQVIRILTFLDGTSFVQMDLPPNTSLNTEERLARMGLLEVFGSNQNPPCYIDSIAVHLNGVIHTANASPTLYKNTAEIIAALSNVRNWLNITRQDALQLVKMSNAQLSQPQAFLLLNDMIANANYAYDGQADTVTGEMHEGVTWIHAHMQELVTLDVTPYREATQGA